MSQPRTKPWEVSQGTSAAAVSEGTSASAPEIPERPSGMATENNNVTSNSYGNYNSGYGSGSYGGGGYGGYGGGYGSLGGGYGSLGGGYGGYGGYGGGGYGGYGAGGYGGYGGYRSMMGGGLGGEPDGLAQNTQATFQLIESMIGAVGGFAQMLESTYMATHNSFFTMMSVAEQFTNLKNALGSVLGIFTLIKWAKKLLAKITGNKNYLKINVAEFEKFQNKKKKDNGRKPGFSFRPLIIFLAAVVGLPFLLKQLIRTLAQQQQRQVPSMDPKNLEFCRAAFDFNPENEGVEMALKKGDLVAVLSKTDPSTGKEAQWWKCRSRDGRSGFVPFNYLEVIKRKQGTVESADLQVISEANQKR